MQIQTLSSKYAAGRHWDNHPNIYAKYFGDFLRRNLFNGEIVDIGCGCGRDVEALNSFGYQTMGIDKSPQEIRSARNKRPRSLFAVMDAERLAFADGSIGAFYMINVIHYVDAVKVIAEMHRTLRSRGFLFIHFNLSITDQNGNVDYQLSEHEVWRLFPAFRAMGQKYFSRFDPIPFPHQHDVLQLIFKKL
ncbi:MAG: class I SAM-dependent methyltransferase [Patescibacteria group bacterium]